MSRYGYIRVSAASDKDADNLNNQKRLLGHCDRIFEDVISGAEFNRPGLNALMDIIMAEDTVEVIAIDRMGRDLVATMALIDTIDGEDVVIYSQREGELKPRSAVGRLAIYMPLIVAEFEYNVSGERTRAGVAKRKARGEYTGGHFSLTRGEAEHVQELISAGDSLREVQRKTGIPRRTIQRIKDLDILSIHPQAWKK